MPFDTLTSAFVLQEGVTKKWCPGCKTLQDRSAFCFSSATKDHLAGWCRACYSEHRSRRGREYYRDYEMRRRYGIGTAEFEALLAEQGGTCAICNELCVQHEYLSVDHNHETGVVRGLLCGRCNQAIGLLREDTSLLASAIQYLTIKAV